MGWFVDALGGVGVGKGEEESLCSFFVTRSNAFFIASPRNTIGILLFAAFF